MPGRYRYIKAFTVQPDGSRGKSAAFQIPIKIREQIISSVQTLTDWNQILGFSTAPAVREYVEGQKHKDPIPCTAEHVANQLNALLDRGFKLSGGAMIPAMHQILGFTGFSYPPIKDFDVYTNSTCNYVEARAFTVHNPFIDVCFCQRFGFELHDISLVEADLFRDINFGTDYFLIVTEECERSWHTGVGRINLMNIINPDRTIKRLMRYSKQYGVKWPISDLLGLLQFGPDKDLFDQVMQHPYLMEA